MTNSDTESSELYKTAMRGIDGYNKWDIEAILAPRAEDCKQRVFPARLERPWLDNAEYREFMTNEIMVAFKGFKVEVLEVVEDPKHHKIALHARSKGESLIGEYANEYMIMMQMTEDDRAISKISEFVDSGYSADYMARLRAHIKK